MRSFLAAISLHRRYDAVRSPPPPIGPGVALKCKIPTTRDQYRLNLSLNEAKRLNRVFGVVSSLSNGAASANTLTPACAQFVLRLNWWAPAVCAHRSFFVRAIPLLMPIGALTLRRIISRSGALFRASSSNDPVLNETPWF